ncbi:5'/3'-nucleotidase SurE [Hahella aquimaris]|uniref:5'/3'-nucleotidase SurE n=1 Tax=Hahella sp. HNIBRBA332 TaxID=3015983 RepID=UPI00273C2C83|nr:5'/3'-nucleotidase SurE [Hahella sp. HNIBRBA332]WLQ11453.1 5'/3'-nucleotidase SurE [Hahella sp. HNIBRBA332]
MKLLLSNDDGVHAPGLSALADELKNIAEIRVIAPDRDHSGASNSLTLTRPLILQKTSQGFFAVDGTPTDCVHMGLSEMFGYDAERVVSGINSHANLGDDVLYSGTVAAAMEGRFLAQPAIAVSLVNRGLENYATAAKVVANLLLRQLKSPIAPRTVLNVNVPDVPLDDIRGIQLTRLGHRLKGGEPHEIVDPRGRKRYWIAAAGEGDDAGPGTDFYAVEHNYVSITPIHVDMTRYDAFNQLQDWLGETE